jgi:probable phosphoglycerate mutase
VVILRHGRTAWNVEHRVQGHSDTPLDDVGRAEAARAAEHLARLPVTAVVSSDLRRAAETARPLAERTGLPLALDHRLRETSYGSWEGRTRAEIARFDPVGAAAWGSDEDVARGGGERPGEVATRVAAALREHVAALPAGGTLVVVTHGGAARGGVAGLLGFDHATSLSLGLMGNCHWAVLAERGAGSRWRLLHYNVHTLVPEIAGTDRIP